MNDESQNITVIVDANSIRLLLTPALLFLRWGNAESKASKWTERDEAIMCACFFKHGFPVDDSSWPTFYQYFPEKARRAVRMKLNTMREDGSLHDHKTVQMIDKKVRTVRPLLVIAAAFAVSVPKIRSNDHPWVLKNARRRSCNNWGSRSSQRRRRRRRRQ